MALSSGISAGNIISATDVSFEEKTIAQIDSIVGRKGTPIVYAQTPPPGTPIAQGMQVIVHTVLPADLALKVLVPTAPATVANVAVQELITLFHDDAFFQSIKGQENLTIAQRTTFATAINQKLAGKGLSGQVTANDAEAAFDAIKVSAQLGVNRTISSERAAFNVGLLEQG